MSESMRLLSEEESAKVAEVSVETIRKYRDCGLLDPVIKDNRTFFQELDIRTLFYTKFKSSEPSPTTAPASAYGLEAPERGKPPVLHVIAGALSERSGPEIPGPNFEAEREDEADDEPVEGLATRIAAAAGPVSSDPVFGEELGRGALESPHDAGRVGGAIPEQTAAGEQQSFTAFDPSFGADFAAGPFHSPFDLGGTDSSAQAQPAPSDKPHRASNERLVRKEEQDLPSPTELIELNKSLREQIHLLREERDWLRERVEKLESRSEREQMLLLSESENVRNLIKSAQKTFWQRALPWLNKS